jgi:PAS domain-containing protein
MGGAQMIDDREVQQAAEAPRTSDARLQLLIEVIAEVQSARTVDDLAGIYPRCGTPSLGCRWRLDRAARWRPVSLCRRGCDRAAVEGTTLPVDLVHLGLGDAEPADGSGAGRLCGRSGPARCLSADLREEPRHGAGGQRADSGHWRLLVEGADTGAALKNIGLLASLSDSAARAERELSERKHAEATLAAAHQRTLDILESIPDAFYTVDHDWRLIFVNRRAEELWRRRREELIGGRLWGAFPGRSSRITAAGCGCGGRSGTVEPPRERGFGTQLIERASTYELDGSVNLDYAQSGLICEVAFPLE